MRIALVVAGGLDRSGRERVIPALLWLVERLARAHAVHVFVLRHEAKASTYELLGATVHDLGRPTGPSGTRSLFQLRRLTAALTRVGPFDVLHGYWAAPAGVLAALAGRRLRIPTVVTFDSGELVSVREIGYGLQRTWRGRQSTALAARLATRVHVCSRFMERLAHQAGFAVTRIPLGVDLRAFPESSHRAEGQPWRLLHVASLNPVKDHTTLLAAMALVVARLGAIHLDIVGEDTMNGEIQRKSAALGLERHVTFHGFQPTDQLAAFYQRAHLCVLSSRHEAAGVCVLEAAASGVPTIGTRVGYIADWSPEAAWGVAVGDADALAEAMVMLLRDRERRCAMAREARARAVAEDADWTAAAMARLYAELRTQG